MGLDMRPMGKPKKGFENRYREIFEMVNSNNIPELSFFDKMLGKKQLTKDELIQEWFQNQTPTYETIKAPMVGRDAAADQWIKERYEELEDKPPLTDFLQEHQGFYVIALAKEKDGVPCYISLGQDENVFRGQFLVDCIDLIGEELVNEAWGTKLADETLDYGHRLMAAANAIAQEHQLDYLREQESPPETEPDQIESKLHIVFSLARWLIFYGKNGHGYEADF
ncbi:hypothetical protein [Flavobacterium muglaense]|nr:hypothetical protein [Flavobacterium muglaense]